MQSLSSNRHLSAFGMHAARPSSCSKRRKNSALMNQLRYKAVEQKTLSSP
jgi:hypothetical protein